MSEMRAARRYMTLCDHSRFMSTSIGWQNTLTLTPFIYVYLPFVNSRLDTKGTSDPCSVQNLRMSALWLSSFLLPRHLRLYTRLSQLGVTDASLTEPNGVVAKVF